MTSLLEEFTREYPVDIGLITCWFVARGYSIKSRLGSWGADHGGGACAVVGVKREGGGWELHRASDLHTAFEMAAKKYGVPERLIRGQAVRG